MIDIDPLTLERLQRAFDRLPDRHAAIFSAKRHDNLTYAEIAVRTGLKPRQVQRILADALYRLDLDIEEQERGIAITSLTRTMRNTLWNAGLALRLLLDRF